MVVLICSSSQCYQYIRYRNTPEEKSMFFIHVTYFDRIISQLISLHTHWSDLPSILEVYVKSILNVALKAVTSFLHFVVCVIFTISMLNS